MIGAVVVGGVLAQMIALPLCWKWELGLRRCAGALAGFAVLAAIVILALRPFDEPVLTAVATTAITLALALAVLLWRFFRDPERSFDGAPGAILSPADGVVVYVRRFERGRLPAVTKHGRSYELDELVRTPLRSDDAIVIGIALSFLDVHVNRAPIAGAVTAQRRYPGRFGSLKNPEAVFSNERASIVVERADFQLAVVLIASRLVRRIVSYVREGDAVALGQRIGVIRFGSQVDLVLPDRDDLHVMVDPGQRVRAGESIVAEVVG